MSATDAHDGLVLRRAGPDDDDALRALNALAFPDNPKSRAEITKWQWWGNPFGDTLVWVWEDGNRIVGQYVAFCAPGHLHGRPATLTLGVDAAIHPDYQGRRLFSPLSRALYDDCIAHGWPLLAYPSNPISVKGIARAGWVQVCRLDVRVIATDPSWMGERFHLPRPVAAAVCATAFRVGRPPGLQVEMSESPPGDIDALWDRVQGSVVNGIARSGAWWRWRYGEHPDPLYTFLAVRDHGELVGACVARVREEFGGRFLCLLEFLATTPAAGRAMVNAIGEGALGPASGAVLTVTPGSALDELAKRSGLRRLPARLDPKPVFFGVVPDPGSTPDPTSLRWSTSWGDLDHI